MKKSLIVSTLKDWVLNLFYYRRTTDLNYFKARIVSTYNVNTIRESKVFTHSQIHSLDIKYVNGVKTLIVGCERPGIFIGVRGNNIDWLKSTLTINVKVEQTYVFSSRPNKSNLNKLMKLINSIKYNVSDWVEEYTPQQKQFIKESIIVVITMILFFLSLYLFRNL